MEPRLHDPRQEEAAGQLDQKFACHSCVPSPGVETASKDAFHMQTIEPVNVARADLVVGFHEPCHESTTLQWHLGKRNPRGNSALYRRREGDA